MKPNEDFYSAFALHTILSMAVKLFNGRRVVF